MAMPDCDSGDGSQTITPGMLIEYRINRGTIIKSDSGYEWATQERWYGNQKITNYYLGNLGSSLNTLRTPERLTSH